MPLEVAAKMGGATAIDTMNVPHRTASDIDRLKQKLANIRASMRDVGSESMAPPPLSLEAAGLLKANQLTVPPPLSLEVAGVFKANGSEARQRLLEVDLDAMLDVVCDEIDSNVVAAVYLEL